MQPPISVTNLSGQQAPPVEVGSRVRVTARDLALYKQAATLKAWRGDTLVLAAERVINCPLASVTRLEVSRGRGRNTAAATGALIGFLVGSGVAAGLAVSVAAAPAVPAVLLTVVVLQVVELADC